MAENPENYVSEGLVNPENYDILLPAMKPKPRLDQPLAIGASIYDVQLRDDLLNALDECTAIRRISKARFLNEALSYFLTLPAYARDQAIHGNPYDLRGQGRPSKDDS